MMVLRNPAYQEAQYELLWAHTSSGHNLGIVIKRSENGKLPEGVFSTGVRLKFENGHWSPIERYIAHEKN